MQIQHNESEEQFYLQEGNNTIGELVYSMQNNNLVIEHTEVDEAYRGKNLGYELVKESVAYARKQHLKIVPVCPFAKAVFEEQPEFKDVLAE